MFACNDVTMSVAGHQTLRVLDGSYVLDRRADVTEVIPRFIKQHPDVPADELGSGHALCMPSWVTLSQPDRLDCNTHESYRNHCGEPISGLVL